MARAKKTYKGYDEVFPDNLRSIMDEKNITQQELADICGVSRQSVSYWKNGESVPDAMQLKKMAEFLEVSADYLIGLTPTPTADTEMRAVCDYTGLIQSSVERLQILNRYNIGDGIHNPVSNDEDIIDLVTCEYDKPIHTINLLLNNPRIIGYIHTYLCMINDNNTSIYQGDRGNSVLFELMLQLRKLRDEFQLIYKEESLKFFEEKDGDKKDGEE